MAPWDGSATQGAQALQQSLNTENVDHAFETVSQHTQRELAPHFGQASQEKTGAAHPRVYWQSLLGGFSQARRATATAFNMVLKARP